LNIVIPMAGAGSRFAAAGYKEPKPFIPLNGKAMIEHVIDNIAVPGAKFYLLVRLEHLNYLTTTSLLDRSDIAFVPIERATEGAACTVLRAETFINSDEPLILANSDQFVVYDREQWLSFIACVDGAIMTFSASETRWSYSLEEGGRVIRVAEKEVISDKATVGLYYFAKGRYFVEAARQMIAKNIRVNNEFYVCPAFNELVAEKFVRNFDVDRMFGLGTPEDFEKNGEYIAKCA
jgi:NDP-sugar pyrophosphorylase family protein